MTTRITSALFMAGSMILLALAARMGWADRNAVMTLLLVLPIIAITQLARGRSSCGCAVTEEKA